MHAINFEHITLYTYALVFLSGIITSFTPCVYPIIPIVVGYLGSITGSATRLLAAVAYVIGLSMVYTTLGMLAALTGHMFGTLTTHPAVYLAFGILILILGGSMMDWYDLPVPIFCINQRECTKKQVILGPFLMGMTSGLVASPCTAPVLAGLLMYIARTKAVVSGGMLMFVFSLGMNTILLALGFSAGFSRFLPKSGGWMVVIKKILAFILLGAGIYFIFKAGTLA